MKIAIVTEIKLTGNARGVESVKTTAFEDVPQAFDFLMERYKGKIAEGDIFEEEQDDTHFTIVTNDDTLYETRLNVVEVNKANKKEEN